ncbi:cysteine proteinase [Parathielavia appendiculata]|uniref:Cysteine proteinase n=1 Tax=Parathielavia appendiculata TaxID=2587402 RepID=A0AAN6Z6E6_9PEZI|nr:cysteine proteinase [Parathielavia appendiculata]
MPIFDAMRQLSAYFKPHADTLDSGPGCSPAPLQTSAIYARDRPSAPKRQKLDARPVAVDEQVEDNEQDAAPMADRRGSQSSFAHSVSPGLHEFQTVEASTKGMGRSNRRRRQPQANRPPVMHHGSRGAVPRAAIESIDSFDELAPVPASSTHQQRKARLQYTIESRSGALPRDGVDLGILKKAQPARPSGLPKRRKRTSYEVIVDDPDELVEDPCGGGASRAGAGPATEDSPKRDPPSLSRRGDLKPTKWKSNSGGIMAAGGVSVAAAVCQPNLRYMPNDRQSSCFLQPTDTSELRAFGDDGNKAQPYEWLKITAKAKSLAYNPESELVKVTQASDQASPISIGSMLFLKLRSSAEASEVVNWARDILNIRVDKSERGKLDLMWDKMSNEITRARNRAEQRCLSDAEIARRPERIADSAMADVALPDKAPTISRTPIRHRMQVSAQLQTPFPPRTGSPTDAVPSGSRSLRTRQTAHLVPRSPTPIVHVISRWSEENRDWAKDWTAPLIIERTTVDKEDIPRLDEGQCLNDNLIGYGLQYLFNRFKGRHPDLHKRVYLHNSFFYEKLKAGRGTINYDGVKSWTAKVDLLSYDYIVVPVNEHYHWWVAIICNPGKLDPDLRRLSGRAESPGKEVKADGASSDVEMEGVTEQKSDQSRSSIPSHNPCVGACDLVDLVSDDKNVSIDLTSRPKAKLTGKLKSGARTYNPEDPRIITLDSLGSTHPQAINLLKKYLVAEFEHKRNKVITDLPPQLGMRAINIPVQNNLCDCGVYLLGYIKQFVEQPDLFIQTLLRKEIPEWDFNPSHLRELWRDTIFGEKARQKNHRASSAKRTPKGSTETSRDPSRETSETVNASNGKRGTRIDSTEQATSAETTGTSANRDSLKADTTTADRACYDPSPNDKEQPQLSSSSSTHRPPQQPFQQNSHDEVVVLAPPQDDDNVLPSIETPDVEELPRPPAKYQNDEPRFIRPLASSSTGMPEDDDTVREVGPASFYSSTKPRRRPNRGSLSSPAAGQRPRMAGTRPMAAVHTKSRFVVDDGSSPGFEPVVESAEMVRNSDPIDLT